MPPIARCSATSAPPRAAGSKSGRRADLLWRGEALAELRRLAARSTALTDDERAFADAAVARSSALAAIRRGIVAAVMVVLAAVAARDGVPQRRREREPRRSRAQRDASRASAATLAEERLTASLIAQGRRELNDDRDMHALAYFARGAAARRRLAGRCAQMVVDRRARLARPSLAVYRARSPIVTIDGVAERLGRRR